VNASELHLALAEVAAVLLKGEANHPPGEWLMVPARGHMRHASIHLEKALLGILHDDDEDHLANAATRLLLASQKIQERHYPLQ
jgi:hypothetical protein